MVRTVSIAASLLGVLTASAASGPFVQGVRTNHAQLAACAFTVLDRAYPARVRMTPLHASNTFKITRQAAPDLLGSGVTRDLDMDIRRAGKGAILEIQPTSAVFGDDEPARRIWREIQGCLPPGP